MIRNAIDPSYIFNPSYRNYVSKTELGTNINPPKMRNPDPGSNQRKTIFFSYYDKPSANFHLFPNENTTFIKVYEPPAKPATSKLLRNMERKASQVKNKLLPTYE